MARRRAHRPNPKPANVTATRDSFQNLAERTGIGTDNIGSFSSYAFNPISRDRILLEFAYRGSFIVRNAIDAIPDDMTREGIDMVSTDSPEDIEIIQHAMQRMQILKQLANGARWGRLYGGAICVHLIDGQNFQTPLRIETVGKGAYHGMAVLDRWMLQPDLVELVSDFGPHFGKPMYYTTTTDLGSMFPANTKIHYTRIVRFDGDNLPFWQRMTENLWGLSILEPLWDRLVAYDSTTNGIAQLAHKAHLRIIRMKDLRANIAAGGKKLEGIARMVENIRRYQTNEGITLLDMEDEYQDHQYTFAGLDNILVQFGNQLAGATKIPVVRLFGQSPGGLNSTGDSDIRNYYDSVRETQNSDLREPLEITLGLIFMSELGRPMGPDFSFDFAPLWQLKEEEKGQLAGTNTNTIMAPYTAGVVSGKTALEELRQQSRITGIWSNITDEDIKAADPVPMSLQGGMGQVGAGGVPLTDPIEQGLAKLHAMPPESLEVSPQQAAEIEQFKNQNFGEGRLEGGAPDINDDPAANENDPLANADPGQLAQLNKLHSLHVKGPKLLGAGPQHVAKIAQLHQDSNPGFAYVTKEPSNE